MKIQDAFCFIREHIDTSELKHDLSQNKCGQWEGIFAELLTKYGITEGLGENWWQGCKEDSFMEIIREYVDWCNIALGEYVIDIDYAEYTVRHETSSKDRVLALLSQAIGNNCEKFTLYINE